jgi:low affinity Fe/Cu permease
MAQVSKTSKVFGDIASRIAHAAGRPIAFILCATIIILWAVSGPIFGFSDTWQLIINTGTTIVTFLMVFLIQNTQNRDGAAIQAKLDELIRVSSGQNAFVGIEHLTEEEVEEIRQKIEERAAREGVDLDSDDEAASEAEKRADRAESRAQRLATEAADRATSGG